MRSKKILRALHAIPAILSLAVLSATALAQERVEEREHLTFEFATTVTTPSASGKIPVTIFERFPISSNELGIKSAVQPEGRVTWNLQGRHTVGVVLSSATFSGDQRVVRETRLLGPLRLRINERVVSHNDVRQWRAFYEYRFDLTRRLSISPHIELRTISIEGRLALPEARRPLEESFSQTLIGPLGGVLVRYRLNRRMSLQTRLAGIHIPDASVAEADAQFRIRVADRVTLLPGWKYSFYSYARMNNLIDVRLRQPYLGVAYSW